MTVPENRDALFGGDVTLAVARFPAVEDTAAPPLIYLEGGPGVGSLETLALSWDIVFAELNRSRDIVVFDQRGTGLSQPSLDCQEWKDLNLDFLDELIEPDEAAALSLEALEPCRQRWADAGIDLTQYNSADSAADVADIGAALGYEVWDLYGISYGTRLALTVMRDHPEGVRSVILDSTYPPEVDGVASIPSTADRAFGVLYDACAEQPDCREAFGDVEDLLFRVVDQLNAEPLTTTVTDVFGGNRYEAILDGDTVLVLVFSSLYSDWTLVDIPLMLAELEDGTASRASLMLSVDLANLSFLSIGQNLSVQCHEEVPYADPAAAAAAVTDHPRLAPLVDGSFTQSVDAFEFCGEWGSGVGEPKEADPVDSDIPTLVVAGQFDPITPPSFGEGVADRLSNATFVVYPGLAHGVAFSDGCPLDITLSFLADPGERLDTSCVDEMPPAEFSTPSAGAEPASGPREVEQFGTTLTAVLPLAWEEVAPGVFSRALSGLDQTSVSVQAAQVGGMGELIVSTFARQLGGDVELAEIDPFFDGSREWRRFSADLDGIVLDIATYEDASSTLAVILTSEAADTDFLRKIVWEIAMETIEIVP